MATGSDDLTARLWSLDGKEKVHPILTAWKEKIVKENLLNPTLIYGYFPCQSCGSDLLLNGKYRVTNLLSAKGGFGNTYEVIDERRLG